MVAREDTICDPLWENQELCKTRAYFKTKELQNITRGTRAKFSP